MMMAQELSKINQEKYIILCVDIQHISLAAIVLFIDKVYFHMCGGVTKQNY